MQRGFIAWMLGLARKRRAHAIVAALYASAVGDETNRTATLNASLAARWSVVSLAWAFLIAPWAPAFTDTFCCRNSCSFILVLTFGLCRLVVSMMIA